MSNELLIEVSPDRRARTSVPPDGVGVILGWRDERGQVPPCIYKYGNCPQNFQNTTTLHFTCFSISFITPAPAGFLPAPTMWNIHPLATFLACSSIFFNCLSGISLISSFVGYLFSGASLRKASK